MLLVKAGSSLSECWAYYRSMRPANGQPLFLTERFVNTACFLIYRSVSLHCTFVWLMVEAVRRSSKMTSKFHMLVAGYCMWIFQDNHLYLFHDTKGTRPCTYMETARQTMPPDKLAWRKASSRIRKRIYLLVTGLKIECVQTWFQMMHFVIYS